MSGHPALVAIDLGAESCRVSLLRGAMEAAKPDLSIVHRFANAPRDCGSAGIRWNLDGILEELLAALHACAERAPEGIASIGVTGWGVDYVRLDGSGQAMEAPYCYRDPRTNRAQAAVHARVPAETLYARTGVQIQPLNTIYQLYADKLAGAAGAPWAMLPEYTLHWLGAPRVAEWTNATHSGLVDPETGCWCEEIFAALGLEVGDAPELVAPGTLLGPVRADLRQLPAFAQTQLIAPACHDTASAVAGIAVPQGRWAYLSSGTWSLAGRVLEETHRTAEACALGFTNLGAAGGGALFHRGLPGMWLLRQCLDHWERESPAARPWPLSELIAAASALPAPDGLLDLDDPAFLPPGDMPARIDTQRAEHGLAPLAGGWAAAPQYANLIFHSLAARYAAVLADMARITGQRTERLCVVGGGSRNQLLNALTAESAGLPVERGSVESSTLGNFAVQLARLNRTEDGVTREAIAEHARALIQAEMEG